MQQPEPAHVPAYREREAILQQKTQQAHLAADVDLSLLASVTTGFTGENLLDLVHEAVATARRQQRIEVTAADFETALTKVVVDGAHLLLADTEERRQAAHHLAGHLLVAWHTPQAVLPQRAYLLDHARQFPASHEAKDQQTDDRPTLLARLDVLLAGAVAVKLTGDKVTAHGEAELAAALQLATHIVSRWPYQPHAPLTPASGRNAFFARLYQSRIKTPCALKQAAHLLLAERQQAVERLLTTHRGPLRALTALLGREEVVDHASLEQLLGERARPYPGTRTDY